MDFHKNWLVPRQKIKKLSKRSMCESAALNLSVGVIKQYAMTKSNVQIKLRTLKGDISSQRKYKTFLTIHWCFSHNKLSVLFY